MDEQPTATEHTEVHVNWSNTTAYVIESLPGAPIDVIYTIMLYPWNEQNMAYESNVAFPVIKLSDL